MKSWAVAAGLTGLLFGPEVSAQESVRDAGLALARAVDLPDQKARRVAALELAQRKDVTIDQWLDICSKFGAFSQVPAGAAHEEADLQVLGKVEKTKISWYVPKSYDVQRPAPLLLAMHGTGTSGHDEHLMWQQVAEKLGMLIVAPSESGPNEGYAFTERERQVALLAVRWLRRRCNVDETRIFCSGESRGGHMTWDLALRNPDRFAALAPMIGAPMLTPAKGLNNLRYLENIAPTPIRDLQGSKDDPQLIFNLRQAFTLLKAFPARDAVLTEFEKLGHSFDFAAIDWVAWLSAQRRDPTPKQVTLRFARKGEARSHWLEVTGYDKTVEEEFRLKLTQKEVDALERKSDEERKLFWHQQCEQRTGRVVASWSQDGPVVVESKGALGFRLLLDDAMVGKHKEIEVVVNGKKKKLRTERSARTLLLEFVERVDRTFLPTVELSVSG